jgi:hypothetical protein
MKNYLNIVSDALKLAENDEKYRLQIYSSLISHHSSILSKNDRIKLLNYLINFRNMREHGNYLLNLLSIYLKDEDILSAKKLIALEMENYPKHSKDITMLLTRLKLKNMKSFEFIKDRLLSTDNLPPENETIIAKNLIVNLIKIRENITKDELEKEINSLLSKMTYTTKVSVAIGEFLVKTKYKELGIKLCWSAIKSDISLIKRLFSLFSDDDSKMEYILNNFSERTLILSWWIQKLIREKTYNKISSLLEKYRFYTPIDIVWIFLTERKIEDGDITKLREILSKYISNLPI